jgi:hypothetical protein
VPCHPTCTVHTTPGETVLIPTVMPMSLSKTGAAFAYWNTEPDGSGIIHGWPADTSFVMPASNVVLYAQWFVTAGLSAGGLTAHYAAAPRRRVHVAVPGAVRGRQGPNGGAPTATSWPTAPSGTGKHSQRSHNLHRPRSPGSGESPSDLSVRRTSRSVRRGRWTQGSHRWPRTAGLRAVIRALASLLAVPVRPIR